MSFFVLDIESLGVESTSVVLSVGMVYVDPDSLMKDNDKAYAQLLDTGFEQNAFFVKFKSVEQTKPPYNRVISKSTLQWWKDKTGEVQRADSLLPSSRDVSVVEGFESLRVWYNNKRNGVVLPIWTRGSLDQMALDSLCHSFDIEPLAPYNAYRDIRTAIDLIYPDGSSGYVEIPDFDRDQVIKHNPVHDCAYDALMLLRGKQ